MAGCALLKATNLGGPCQKDWNCRTVEVWPGGGLAKRPASTCGPERGPLCEWNCGLGGTDGAEFFCVNGPALGVIFIKDVVETDLRRFAYYSAAGIIDVGGSCGGRAAVQPGMAIIRPRPEK